MDKLCADYGSIILLRDFNVEVKENISDFMSTYNLKSLIKQKTCFENPGNPSCIDPILQTLGEFPRIPVCLKRDFHKLKNTVLNPYFPRPKPKIINYRDYRILLNDEFRAELDNEILKHDTANIKYQHFLNIFREILNKHTPMKIKYLRKVKTKES